MFNILIATIACLFFLNTTSMAASLPDNIENYFLGYQPGLSRYMEKFNMVIMDSRGYSKEEIIELKRKGVTVIGYVSIGESITLQKGDGLGPGGYASWYFDSDKNGFPDQNKEFKSYYANVTNPLWVSQVIDVEMKNAADKGVDGFFLDTVDTIEKYPKTKSAMIDVIKKIRQEYPDKILIQNWGFSIIETTAPSINAVMWESWYPDSNEQWTIDWQNKLKELRAKYGINILTLGYYEVYSDLERYYEVSKSLDFLPFVISDSQTNKMVEFFSKEMARDEQEQIKPVPNLLKHHYDACLSALLEFITKLLDGILQKTI